MKRSASICIILTLVCLLSACTAKQDKKESKASFNEVKSQASAENSVKTANLEKLTADDYVKVTKKETELGIIEFPTIDTEKLKGEYAVKANTLFENIVQDLIDKEEDAKKERHIMESNGGYVADASKDTICETRYALNKNILSILIHYVDFNYSDGQRDYFEAVNLNTDTGEAIKPEKVLEIAGFTLDDAKNSIKNFAEIYMFHIWENAAFFELGEEETLPDGWGDPSIGWQDTIETISNEFDKKGPNQSDLPLYPTVFHSSDGKVQVPCKYMPSTEDESNLYMMINIGKTYESVEQNNPYDYYGNAFGNFAKTEDEAAREIADILNLDDNYISPDGVKLMVTIDRVANLSKEGMDDSVPYYIVHVYENFDTHTSTYGWYAAGVFDDDFMELDVGADRWNKIEPPKK